MIGFANSSRSLCLDTRYLTFKPNFLRPRIAQRNFFGVWRGGKKDPFGLELSLRFTKAYRSWPINVSIQEVAAWPLGCSSWFILTWQPWARVVASVQTAVALKRLEASEWYYDSPYYGVEHLTGLSEGLNGIASPGCRTLQREPETSSF